MSQRMHVCDKCLNKVRTLYEWRDCGRFCGMCQQENIEVYENTVVYRAFLMCRLTRDFVAKIVDQVLFPGRGFPRRSIRFVVLQKRCFVSYVRYQRSRYLAKIRASKEQV